MHKWTCNLYYIMFVYGLCSVIFPLQAISVLTSRVTCVNLVCLIILGTRRSILNTTCCHPHQARAFFPPLQEWWNCAMYGHTLHHQKHIYISHIYMCVFTHVGANISLLNKCTQKGSQKGSSPSTSAKYKRQIQKMGKHHGFLAWNWLTPRWA